MKKNFIASLCVLLAVVIVFGAAITGLNTVTAPIIEANNAAAASGALLTVLPEGKNFEQLDLTTLTGVPATVTAIHKETNGLGFVVACETTSQYSAGPMQFMMGLDATGVICGMNLTNYQDSVDFSKDFDYPATYVGQNSTLADVQLFAGCTFSSTAFLKAVEE